MVRIAHRAVASLAALLACAAPGLAEELTARQIMERVDARDDGDLSTQDLEMVLIDKNQAMGPLTTNMYDSRLAWTTIVDGRTVPTGTHRNSAGRPEGGIFLFEDGHVEWFNGRQISLGAGGGSIGDWMCFFRLRGLD